MTSRSNRNELPREMRVGLSQMLERLLTKRTNELIMIPNERIAELGPLCIDFLWELAVTDGFVTKFRWAEADDDTMTISFGIPQEGGEGVVRYIAVAPMQKPVSSSGKTDDDLSNVEAILDEAERNRAPMPYGMKTRHNVEMAAMETALVQWHQVLKGMLKTFSKYDDPLTKRTIASIQQELGSAGPLRQLRLAHAFERADRLREHGVEVTIALDGTTLPPASPAHTERKRRFEGRGGGDEGRWGNILRIDEHGNFRFE